MQATFQTQEPERRLRVYSCVLATITLCLPLQNCVRPSQLVSIDNSKVSTVRSITTHLPFHHHYLYNSVELSPRQWRQWHSVVSLYRVYDSHIVAWIQSGKCWTRHLCISTRSNADQPGAGTHLWTTHTHTHSSLSNEIGGVTMPRCSLLFRGWMDVKHHTGLRGKQNILSLFVHIYRHLNLIIKYKTDSILNHRFERNLQYEVL